MESRSDCFSNNLRYSLMNYLPGYVAIFLNHCYKLISKFKIIHSNHKPLYSLFLLILEYPSLHVAARINIYMLYRVGMQGGGMYSSMTQCINIPVHMTQGTGSLPDPYSSEYQKFWFGNETKHSVLERNNY